MRLSGLDARLDVCPVRAYALQGRYGERMTQFDHYADLWTRSQQAQVLETGCVATENGTRRLNHLAGRGHFFASS